MSAPNDATTTVFIPPGGAAPAVENAPSVPLTTAVDSEPSCVVQSPLGTLIDPAFHAVDVSRDDLLVSIRHYTEMQGIEARLESNQLDAKQRSLVPGFKLLHRIGKGAYGTVWDAQSTDCDEERVAIKFFTLSQWEPMHREVSRIARLEGCSGVMPFKQYADKKADPPYYVMPFAKNGSLADLLHKRGPLPVPEALRIFRRIIETMAFVHTKGVIHCDLKPANILLNESNEPLIADFGQAQLGSQEPGSFGTLFYMPPEQASAKNTLPDANWDVYALGAILYELLTGRRPRTSDSVSKKLADTKDVRSRLDIYRRELSAMPKVLLRKAVQRMAPANAKLIDPALEALVEDCLSIDPKDRPRSAGQLRERLQKRDWWARQRPILLRAAGITMLFLFVLCAFGAIAARILLRDNERKVISQVNRSLQRTAGITGKLIEEVLRDRVAFVQQNARLVIDPDRGVKNLPTLIEKLETSTKPADEALTTDERAAVNSWLENAATKMPWYHTESDSRFLTLIAVVDGRGHFLGRVQGNGKADVLVPGVDDLNRKHFRRNWAWRDYFSGEGNRFDEENNETYCHAPIAQCHISQLYRSQAAGTPQRIDISAPVVDANGKVIALLVTSIDGKKDMIRWLQEAQKNLTPADEDDSSDSEIPSDEILLVNDRGQWAWHTAAPEELLMKKDPDCLYCREKVEWCQAEDAGVARYHDPLARSPHSSHHVSYVPIRPFNTYSSPESLRDKKWMVAVQVDEEIAKRPLNELWVRIVGIGLIALMMIGGLILFLWIWWIRTLRRQELLAHG